MNFRSSAAGRRGAFAAVTAIMVLGAAAPVSGSMAPASTPDRPCAKHVLAAPAQGAAAVAALGANLVAVAARNGVTGRELAEHLRADRTLWVDQCGDLLFQDELVADVDLSATSADNATWPSTISPADAFLLHSRPGAERVVFLDFDGHAIAGTGWNSLYGQDAWTAPAFSSDADPTTFADAERNVIIETWRRVAQDYAPFNVDVTTQDPGEGAITRSGATDTQFGTRVLISPDATQAQCGCGGRAYVNVFARTSSHSYYQPAWVYPQALSNNAKYIAEAASHEAGHTLGLSHDGTATSSYYSGSGGWGPIMGSPYGQAVTQWSNGSYANANNTEDDIASISGNGAPLVGDDVGDSAGSARILSLPGTVSALINSRADKDAFTVTTSGGRVTASAYPLAPGINLDLSMTLTDTTGNVVASSSPVFSTTSVVATTGAAVDVDVAAGTYTITIDGTGNGIVGSVGESDYGSVGWYTLTADGAGVAPSPTSSPTSAPTSSPTSSTAPDPTVSQTTSPTSSPTSTTTPEPSVSPTAQPPTLEGSALIAKSSWTARMTLRGSAGASASGSWTPGGKGGGCTISTGASSCSFDLTGLSKRTTSASFKDVALGTVTVARP